MSMRDRLRLQLEDSAQQHSSEHADGDQVSSTKSPAQSILRMQRTHGNQAVRRMLASVQRASLYEGGPLNSQISEEINSRRGAGSALDSNVQAEMGTKLGHDFSGVSVHTDSKAHELNTQLGAQAFTTGKDIFFSEGAYQPGSDSGKHLLAHELTHVIHQDGTTPSGDLTLGPAEDSYESEADSMADAAMSSEPASAQAMRDPDLQRQEIPEEEEAMQMKRNPDLQRQAEEEEEMMQAKRDPDLQRQAEEEEEMMQAKRDPDLQRQAEEEEEMMQAKRDPDLQRQEIPEEEEELMMKRDPSLQRRPEFDI